MPDGLPAAGLSLRTRVFVEGLEVQALIGVLGHEQGQTQPLILDVELDVTSPRSDDLSQALDYRAIAEIAQELAARQTGLVEIFAQRLAARLMGSALVHSARVRLRKPDALEQGIAGTEVTLSRS
ncbi:dihydroneopterin aldolase [Oceanicola sp. S124]|uniref:dihydroneopterin aldolase n=1 Tax=Oceanicola sp. S124 TaxID=1042378 RepID=UPI00068354D2|nr:dihydroneopterin aldolase [Oceanicola sp. S124]